MTSHASVYWCLVVTIETSGVAMTIVFFMNILINWACVYVQNKQNGSQNIQTAFRTIAKFTSTRGTWCSEKM